MKHLRNLDKTKLAIASLGLGIVLFFSINIFSNSAFKTLRLDLTEDRLFTLSEGTINILSNIEEPITLKLYYSKLLGERSPQHAVYFERIRELLDRYGEISGGKVQMNLIHPEPFSISEDSAVSNGMLGIPLNNADDLGYFGLSGSNSTDDQVAIPFFTPEREAFLEYDLTKIIYTLGNPKRQVIGIMSTLPINGGASQPPFSQAPKWPIVEKVAEFFEVRPLPKELRQIPNDIDILLLVHPKGLDDFTLYAIDQFVLGGGRALVFVDANAEVDVPPDGRMTSLPQSDFNKILKGWGLKLSEGMVAGDLDTARRVNIQAGKKMSVVDYVVWLTLGKKNFTSSDAVTAGLRVINMAGSGILETIGVKGVQILPLITTGKNSMQINAEKVMRRPDAIALFRDFKVGGKPLVLAARVRGNVLTAFPNGAPKNPSGTNKGKPAVGVPEKHLAKSITPANLIVIADVDMLHERFWAEIRQLMGQQLFVPFANNADLVVNALDNLSGSNSLIGLRGRAPSGRPFSMVQNIRQAAELEFRAKERALQEKLEGARNKLRKLQRQSGAKESIILTRKDRADIEEIKKQMISTRGELRDVQRSLRKDLENLEAILKFINIGLIPILLVVGAIIVIVTGRIRRKNAITTN